MSQEQMESAIEFLLAHAADQSAKIDKLIAAMDRLYVATERDAENIRALVRVAELHHERLARLESGDIE